MKKLLPLILLAGCTGPILKPYDGPPMPPIEYKPYVLPQPYMIPRSSNPAPATRTCTTTSQPGLGGPSLITTCN